MFVVGSIWWLRDIVSLHLPGASCDVPEPQASAQGVQGQIWCMDQHSSCWEHHFTSERSGGCKSMSGLCPVLSPRPWLNQNHCTRSHKALLVTHMVLLAGPSFRFCT